MRTKLVYLALAAAGIANAQWPTIDVAAVTQMGKIWQEDATTSTRMLEEVQQATKVAGNTLNLYMLEQSMAQSFKYNQRAAWMMAVQMGVADLSKTTYGENAKWAQMINGNPSLASGVWTTATVPLAPMGTTPDPTIKNLLPQLASVNITDGSSTKCLQQIAQNRQAAQLNLSALMSLRTSQLSSLAGYNSLIQQLNMLNASQGQANTQAKAASDIQACQVEQQVIANKMQRDAMVEHIDTLTVQSQYAASDPGFRGPAQALSTYQDR